MSESQKVRDGEHQYARVNLSKPRDYCDYESLKVQWNSPDQYELIRRIGRGKYSDVFLAYDRKLSRRVAIKVLKPVKKKKILHELKVLQNLKGCPNIIELYDTVRDPNSKIPSFIFEYVEASDFRMLFPHFSDLDVRRTIFQVLLALEYAHSRGIMHRDVKPNNVCIDFRQKTLKLIDWGLAEFYHPETSYDVRVASRYFKGPELLVELMTYDYRLDMWSLGCMMAGMIFIKEPFFCGKDNADQLVRIVRVLGSSSFQAYLSKYNLTLPGSLHNLTMRYPRKPWSHFVCAENCHLCPNVALDFLDRLLRYDHNERIQAAEALQDAYFDPVRMHRGAQASLFSSKNAEERKQNS